jgi:citrate lyase subunit beta/citryl-CoA lyase
MPSHEEPELAHARSRLVLASRAAGLEGPLDSPWFHLKDAAGFAQAIARSRRMGFQGRLCIHPDQVAPANEGYAPTPEELARAERIVAAFRQAEARGAAAIEVDGQMVDYPIVSQAERLLGAMKDAK